jgi:hypothetical protein
MFERFVNLDARESIFFARELEHVKSATYDILYPELKMQTFIPVSYEAGPAAEAIIYQQFGAIGIAKVISNYGDDLPRVDVVAAEFPIPVRTIGDSYGYNVQEIRASAATNKNLPVKKAAAARRAIEKKIDDIALSARPTDGVNAGLCGLLYHANTTKGTVATRGGHVTWADKTPTEILADMNAAVSDMITLTKGVEIPDSMLLPIDQWSKVSTSPLQAGSDTTILQFFLKNNPSIKNVDWLAQLKDVNPVPSTGVAANTNCMVVYKRDPMKLTLEIPAPFEQLDPQADGLEYVVPCLARCAGVLIYYPLSVAVYEGI